MKIIQSFLVSFLLASAVLEAKIQSKKTVSVSKNVWKDIQKACEPAIVQIVSYVVRVDLLCPFIKESTEGRGSGAFIEGGRGLILTCFHVVENATKVMVQMPLYFGKRLIPASVVGVCPDYDIAVLQLDPAVCSYIEREYGSLPALSLGNSDDVYRSDQLLGLGFPLGDESLKSVTGVVSGHEHIVSRSGLRFCNLYAIQVTTPLNPGSSGGIVLNEEGTVVGIATAGAADAQSVGFVAPINHYKLLCKELQEGKLVRKPSLGVAFCPAKDNEIAHYLGNPTPAGCYITHVLEGGLGSQLGLKEGDMVYSLNGFVVDPYGCIQVGRIQDRRYVSDYLGSLSLGDDLIIGLYRKGEKLTLKGTLALTSEPAVRWHYFPYDNFDFEVIGGIVIQELSLNIIALFEHTQCGNQYPGVRARLLKYKEEVMRDKPALMVTQVFSGSVSYQARSFGMGTFINEVNGQKVRTLQELREKIASLKDESFIVFKSEEKEILALPIADCVQDEPRISQIFGYPITPAMRTLIQKMQ